MCKGTGGGFPLGCPLSKIVLLSQDPIRSRDLALDKP